MNKIVFLLLTLGLGCKSTLIADSVTCRASSGEVMFSGEDCFFTAGNGVTCEKPTRQMFDRPVHSICTVLR